MSALVWSSFHLPPKIRLPALKKKYSEMKKYGKGDTILAIFDKPRLVCDASHGVAV